MSFFYTDLPFYLAVVAIGLGLSLASYRMFAVRFDWPMGVWHRNRPGLPILLGILCVVGGVLFAVFRSWSDFLAGWSIVGFGLLLAIVWTGILRVASQVSLIAAPVAAGLLMLWWFGGPDALEYSTVRSEVRELRRELGEAGVISPRRDDQGTGQPRR